MIVLATTAALLMLAGAVALGAVLAVLAMRGGDGTSNRIPMAALAHGSLGVAGFAVLLLALQGPARGLRTGTESFGMIAAWLFGVAILLGLAIGYWHGRGRGAPNAVIAIHAGVAISGFTVLLAWISLG